MKWSDGNEVTTDDVKFWWEDVMLQQGHHRRCPLPYLIRPAGRRRLEAGRAHDRRQVHLEGEVPGPEPAPADRDRQERRRHGRPTRRPASSSPSHYLKKFHPQVRPGRQGRRSTRWRPTEAADLGRPVGQGRHTGGADRLLVPQPGPAGRQPPGRSTKPLPADPVRDGAQPLLLAGRRPATSCRTSTRSSTPSTTTPRCFKLWIAQGKIDMQMRGMSTSAPTRSTRRTRARAATASCNWRAARPRPTSRTATCPTRCWPSCSTRPTSARR